MIKNKFPVSIERDLIRIYRDALKTFEKKIIPKILSAWKPYVERRFDIDADDPFSEIDAAITAIVTKYKFPEAKVRKIFASLNNWSYNTTIQKTRQSFEIMGISEIDIIRTDPQIVRFITKYTETNAGLIKEIILEDGRAITSAIESTVKKTVQDLTKKAVSYGESKRTLSAAIRESTGVIQNKADFWARDQIGKAYGDMNRYRHEKAGFPGYIWMANLDNRLRDSHAERHGKYYAYDEPGIIPGEDYNCRCDATPALDPNEALSKTQIDRDLKEVQDERAWAKGETEKKRKADKARMLEIRKQQKTGG